MSYKHIVKRENGFIKEYKKEYSQDKKYSPPQGWEVVDTLSKEYHDYKDGKGDYAEDKVFNRNEDYKTKRIKEYGSVEEQLEYIVENGLDAFITRQSNIKLKYPKG